MIDSTPSKLENAYVLVFRQWIPPDKACVLLIRPFALYLCEGVDAWMLMRAECMLLYMYIYNDPFWSNELLHLVNISTFCLLATTQMDFLLVDNTTLVMEIWCLWGRHMDGEEGKDPCPCPCLWPIYTRPNAGAHASAKNLEEINSWTAFLDELCYTRSHIHQEHTL